MEKHLEQLRSFIKAANSKGWLLREFHTEWQKIIMIKQKDNMYKQLTLTIWSDTGRVKIIVFDGIEYINLYTIEEGLKLL